MDDSNNFKSDKATGDCLSAEITLQCKTLRLKEECDAAIIEDRVNYEEVLAGSIAPDNFFKYYNSLRSNSIPSSIKYLSDAATDSAEQAELFNVFFATVFNQPSGSIQTFSDKTDITIDDFAIDEHFSVKFFVDFDVTEATGHDNIPARVFKHTSNAVAKSLKTIL